MSPVPPKGSLDALVLAALEAEPAHGYAIVRRLVPAAATSSDSRRERCTRP